MTLVVGAAVAICWMSPENGHAEALAHADSQVPLPLTADPAPNLIGLAP